MKTIHQYAREIEEEKKEEDENVVSNENSFNDKNLHEVEEDNFTFIKDIKQYYNQIHHEIYSLKNIIIDSSKSS